MRAIFITGIPTAGKSHLAKMLVELTGAIHVQMDDLFEPMESDPRFAKYANFYWDQDEKTYYTTTTREQQWNNLVWQCEGLWPGMLEKVQGYADETKPVVFDGVSILPHLAKRDLPFPGVVLIGRSKAEVLERIAKLHRWGNTPELHQLEADAFFEGERPHYKSEAERYGYKVFETAEEALPTALELLR